MNSRKELRTILCVDDDKLFLDILDLILNTTAGVDAFCCASGQEALPLAEKLVPDMILLDVLMPGMDGPATLTELRRLPSLADTPIVFLTAETGAERIAHLIAIGAAGVIPKPLEPLTLSAQVLQLWQNIHEEIPEPVEG